MRSKEDVEVNEVTKEDVEVNEVKGRGGSK